MTKLCVNVVITIFFFAQVLTAPVADAEPDPEACFFGDYGNYGQQRPPQIIIIRPGNNIPGNPPIIGGNPPGTIIGPTFPNNPIILNKNAVQPGKKRKAAANKLQGGRNPGQMSYPLYYEYGFY